MNNLKRISQSLKRESEDLSIPTLSRSPVIDDFPEITIDHRMYAESAGLSNFQFQSVHRLSNKSSLLTTYISDLPPFSDTVSFLRLNASEEAAKIATSTEANVRDIGF